MLRRGTKVGVRSMVRLVVFCVMVLRVLGALALGARVGGIVSAGQMLKIQTGVDLRGTDVGVTQQLLHRPQITAGLQQVAGKRMAQHVRVDWRGQPRLQAAAAQALPNGLRG